MELEIKLKNYLSPLLMILAFTIFITIFSFKDGFDLSAFQILGALWMIFELPAVILHVQYLYLNRGFKVVINEGGIIITKDGLEFNNLESQDINYIYIYKSAAIDDGYFRSPQAYYHYAEIVPKSGKTIYITSLLTKDVEKSLRILKEIKLYKEYKFFCMI